MDCKLWTTILLDWVSTVFERFSVLVLSGLAFILISLILAYSIWPCR